MHAMLLQIIGLQEAKIFHSFQAFPADSTDTHNNLPLRSWRQAVPLRPPKYHHIKLELLLLLCCSVYLAAHFLAVADPERLKLLSLL